MDDWRDDLDADKVSKMAEVDIKPQVKLPDVDESITVTFTSEPYNVVNDKLPNGSGIFVDVDSGDGIEKQMVMPKSLRMNLAAEMERQEADRVAGMTVVVGAQMANLPEYGESKVYWVRKSTKAKKVDKGDNELE